MGTVILSTEEYQDLLNRSKHVQNTLDKEREETLTTYMKRFNNQERHLSDLNTTIEYQANEILKYKEFCVENDNLICQILLNSKAGKVNLLKNLDSNKKYSYDVFRKNSIVALIIKDVQ